MLNILIFSPFALENGRGGEISAMELAVGLQRFYDVTLLDTNRLLGKPLLSKKTIDKKLKSIKQVERIRFATLNFFNKNFAFPYPSEIIKLNKKVKNNDIIYFSVHDIKVSIMFMLYNILNRRSKFIIGYRKPLHSEKFLSLYNLKYRFSILLLSIFNKRIYYHTISQHAKKFLENFYDSNRIFHFTHGIELSNFNENIYKKEGNNKLKFIYVGNLDDVHKGFGVLLSGIRQFLEENKNLKVFFEFCGVGPLESELKKLEIEYPQFIKYNGYVSNDKIPEYYKRNEVFLFSSRREPFGRVIIEALASGLIILCTKTFGSIEILTGKKFAFFINKLNPDVLKEEIVKIYNFWKKNPSILKKLQMSAKEYAFQNFSFSLELEMFKKLVDKIREV